MLVITRKKRERIKIGDDVVITVLRTQAGHVRLGIEAPRGVPIVRDELPPRQEATIDKITAMLPSDNVFYLPPKETANANASPKAG